MYHYGRVPNTCFRKTYYSIRLMSKYLLLLCLLISLAAKGQTSLYVDSSVSASGAGTSWATAYKTLNEALDSVNKGSTATKYTVHIARGTYYTTGIQTSSDRDSAFLIARGGVTLLGAYPSGGGSRNIALNTTILDGNIGSSSLSTDNSYHVLAVIGAGSDTVTLDGVNIQNGSATSVGLRPLNGVNINRTYGGAVYCYQVNQLFVKNCNFSSNTALASGGAVYNESASTDFIGCVFSNNVAVSGGAICWPTYSTNHSSLIRNCMFNGNSASSGGGALLINQTGQYLIQGSVFSGNQGLNGGAIYDQRQSNDLNIDSCSFSQNVAAGSSYNTGLGGAFYSDAHGGSIQISRCTFSGNTTTGYNSSGGAVYAKTNLYSSVTGKMLANCVFTNNRADYQGGALYYQPQGWYGADVDSCHFIGNKAGASGGGIYATGTPSNNVPAVRYCRFTNDTALEGGGLYLLNSKMNYSRCNFRQNKADRGGGIYLYYAASNSSLPFDTVAGNTAIEGAGIYANSVPSTFTIHNCLISGNKASGNGGGVYNTNNSSYNISNCTLAGDSASKGNAIFNNFSSPLIRNSIIWEGSGGVADSNYSNTTVTYSTVHGGYAGIGNLSGNPMFLNPLGASAAPTTGGNYQTQPCSPVVEAGSNSINYTGTLDIAGNPRKVGGQIDQGAYEYPNLFPAPISGSNTLCVGNTLQLGNAIPGGTWTHRNSAVASINGTGLMTALAAGTDTVTYTVAGGLCPFASTKTVTVYPYPAVPAISGPDSVCTKDSIVLSNTLAGGVWSTSNANTLRIDYMTGAVTGINASSSDTVFYTVTNAGGCSSSSYKVIYTKPIAIAGPITGRMAICLNDTAQLNNSVANGTWTSSNNAVATVNSNGLVQAIGRGNTAISYRVSINNGCSDSTETVVLQVDTISRRVFIYGMYLQAEEIDGDFQWYSCNAPGVPISGETNRVFTAPDSGLYYVVISSKGCATTSDCYTIATLNTGTSVNAPVVRIYPNPARNEFVVETNTLNARTIVVRDLTGREVLHRVPSARKTIIALDPLLPGIYSVEVDTGVGISKHRLNVLR
jgi:predicted outer membrane repeat protein